MMMGVRAPVFSWGCRYAVLALRAERLHQATTGHRLIEYRGPEAWIEDLQDEVPVPAAELVKDADELLADLPALMLDQTLATELRKTVEEIRAVVDAGQGQPTSPSRRLFVDVDALFGAK
ncbi:hypothetical protein [Micromonospora palomenae]|uniref:hypothetical protein n=1 Tax=Micromonospora palomenae TaxID=1461247 RepID=UPI0012B8CC89|nr:hypothetical protein [Micromonospora palomenae]